MGSHKKKAYDGFVRYL